MGIGSDYKTVSCSMRTEGTVEKVGGIKGFGGIKAFKPANTVLPPSVTLRVHMGRKKAAMSGACIPIPVNLVAGSLKPGQRKVYLEMASLRALLKAGREGVEKPQALPNFATSPATLNVVFFEQALNYVDPNRGAKIRKIKVEACLAKLKSKTFEANLIKLFALNTILKLLENPERKTTEIFTEDKPGQVFMKVTSNPANSRVTIQTEEWGYKLDLDNCEVEVVGGLNSPPEEID